MREVRDFVSLLTVLEGLSEADALPVPATAVGLVCRLRDLGATVALDDRGRVVVDPASVLTPALAAAIRSRLPALRKLLPARQPLDARRREAARQRGCLVCGGEAFARTREGWGVCRHHSQHRAFAEP